VVALSNSEFGKFQRFIFDAAGISLSPSKKALVSGRLAKRLTACRVGSYAAVARRARIDDSDIPETLSWYFSR
jgi:chemotaxis methyl-accepting protein methylase